MNKDDIIRMAEQAGVHEGGEANWVEGNRWELFANLVAAAERERIKWDTIHSCHPECDKPVCVAIRAAVEEEREACAALCDRVAEEDRHVDEQAELCAFAIRERGAP